MYAMFFMVWFAWIYCSLTISYDSITLVDVATMRRRHFISIITIMSSDLSGNVSGLSKKKKPQDISFLSSVSFKWVSEVDALLAAVLAADNCSFSRMPPQRLFE